jgi:hypothetical protein
MILSDVENTSPRWSDYLAKLHHNGLRGTSTYNSAPAPLHLYPGVGENKIPIMFAFADNYL